MGSALHALAYDPNALAFLESLQPKFRRQIARKINALTANPYPPGSRVVQQRLHEDRRVHRIRSGDYRVLYSVRDDPPQIIVLDIGHRKDIYK